MKTFRVIYFAIMLLCCFSTAISKLTVQSYIVNISVKHELGIDYSIKLNWAADSNTVDFTLKKKLKGEIDWTETKYFKSNITNYEDFNVKLGKSYEYSLISTRKDSVSPDTVNYYLAYGYAYAGAEVPETPFKGKSMILVDNTVLPALTTELTRLAADLSAEGWKPYIIAVPRAEKFNTDSVLFTKHIIDSLYFTDSLSLWSAILIGRVPVPYSGVSSLDGHWDHKGAWVADVFYAVINGEWTDMQENISSPREETKNVAGDGKYDQNEIPKDAVIQLGRIDMFNLPSFPKSEIELLRDYLNKNHAFRTNALKVRYKALVNDRFTTDHSEIFGSNAYTNFNILVGIDSIENKSFRYDLANDSYIWAYGCANGAYTSIELVAYPDDFAKSQYNAVFTILFGSYAGDWDFQDNILRSALASAPSILTCTWSGRPFWFFHHMALGESIGFSTLMSQNNKYLYESTAMYGFRGTHISLLGDPTLKMYNLSAPSNLILKPRIQDGQRIVDLSWDAPSEQVTGYNIYRAESADGNYVKVNKTPILTTSFTDDSAYFITNSYIVRAVKLQETPAGSFYNESHSITQSYNFHTENRIYFDCVPTLPTDNVLIYLDLPDNLKVNITVFDLKGNLIKTIADKDYSKGIYKINWKLDDNFNKSLASGMYFIRLNAGDYMKTEKIIIEK